VNRRAKWRRSRSASCRGDATSRVPMDTGTVFEDFIEETIDVGEAQIFTRHGGEGPPVLLLHGHPRTSATWHLVAPRLVSAGYSVICADLRGYGRSLGPAPTPDHSAHSKRAVAEDMVAVMRHLGHERFALVGHDRGSYVALRLALDHPDQLSALSLLDCIPISEHLARTDAEFATRWWHWFFYAQPDIPEQVINADPDGWYRGDPVSMGQDNYDEWREATRNPAVIRAMLEDYRAGLTVDAEHERADRAKGVQVEVPLLVLWSTADDLEDLYGNPLTIWNEWAREVDGQGINCGHHMAEDAPDKLAEAIAQFLAPHVQ